MASDICVRLGHKIRELRMAKGWKQIDLAEAAKINEGYVSDLEIGKKEICLRNLQRVANAFGMSPSELLRDL
jgi:transcriptional regulator with XRE-family HTH domain